MTASRIGDVLALRRPSYLGLPRTLESGQLPTVARRWKGVPTSGGMGVIYPALQAAMADEERVQAVLDALPKDDLLLLAAYARFGGIPLSDTQAAAPFVGSGLLPDPATLRHRERSLGKLGLAAEAAGLLWPETGGGSYGLAVRRFTPLSRVTERFPWTWTPLEFPAAQAPELEHPATPPAVYFAGILAAALALRGVPKALRKDGMLSAAAVTATNRALAPFDSALADPWNAVDAEDRVHGLVVQATAIAFLRNASGDGAEWPECVAAVMGTGNEPIDQLVRFWRFRVAVGLQEQEGINPYAAFGGTLTDPLLVAEAILRLALGSPDWVHASALRDHLSEQAAVARSRYLSDDDTDARDFVWSESFLHGNSRNRALVIRDLWLARLLFELRSMGWIDLGVRGDQLLLRPSAWARWIAGHERPAARLAPMVDGSGSLLVDPAGLALADVALLGTVGKLVRATDTMLTYHITSDTVARGLALGVSADSLAANLERIAGRPLDAISAGGVKDATRNANRFEKLDRIDVKVSPDGSFQIAPAGTVSVQRPAFVTVDRFGGVKIAATTDLVAKTRMARITEDRGDVRSLTVRSVAAARASGLPFATIEAWVSEHCHFEQYGHWASLRTNLRHAPVAGHMVRCHPEIMYMVAAAVGAKGVKALEGEYHFVPADEYEAIADELERRGLLLRG